MVAVDVVGTHVSADIRLARRAVGCSHERSFFLFTQTKALFFFRLFRPKRTCRSQRLRAASALGYILTGDKFWDAEVRKNRVSQCHHREGHAHTQRPEQRVTRAVCSSMVVHE